MHEGSTRLFEWMLGGNAGVAQRVAASIGATEQGMALVQSFTVGLAQLAPLLKHRPKVLLIGHDYPTLHAPFALPGFQGIVVQPEADGTISLDTLRSTLERERPQVVAISEVQWLTGFRIDLSAVTALCRAFGAWSLVDITQSRCAVPLNVQAAGNSVKVFFDKGNIGKVIKIIPFCVKPEICLGMVLPSLLRRLLPFPN